MGRACMPGGFTLGLLAGFDIPPLLEVTTPDWVALEGVLTGLVTARIEGGGNSWPCNCSRFGLFCITA
jgi:hypothetical protein